MAKKRTLDILFSDAVHDEGPRMGGYFRTARARGLSENTLNDYKTAFAHWLRICGDRKLRQYAIEDVENFLLRLRSEEVVADGVARRRIPRRAAKTISNYYTAISALWTWAHKRNYVDRHIVRAVESPTVQRKPIEPLTNEQIIRLVNATAQSMPYHNNPFVTHRRSTAERDKALILVLYDTALRISECLNLRVADLAFNRYGGKVHVIAGKGDKDRYISFGSRCSQALQVYMDLHDRSLPEQPLFINIDRYHGQKMDRGHTGKLISKLGRRARIKRRVSPHLLRTTAACHLALRLNPFQLKEVLGHSRIETTMRYVQAANLKLDEAMQRASPADNLRL